MKQLVAVLCMAVMTTLAFAQPQQETGMGMGPGGRRADRPMRGRADLIAKLNLTEDQQAQLQKLRINFQKKQTELRSKIRLIRLDMQELFTAPNPDRAAIEKKMKEVSDLQYQEKLNGLDHLFSMKAILTPEQQKIVRDHVKRVGPEFWDRMMQQRRGGW
jgi:Spy/CpxP family protein refolding chaperone